MPQVFIGVPTLNRPQLVRETIRSIAGQTFGDFRVIVSDNASDGGAADQVRAFIHDLGDPRIGFHGQPRNVGEYGQGRFFLRQAAEPYFVILHDDDVLEPGYLERAVQILAASPELAYVVANPYFMDQSGRRLNEETEHYFDASGRRGRRSGPFDVLPAVFPRPTAMRRLRQRLRGGMLHGFTPLSGTCFRLSALRASGFVDDDCEGNYPFEFNILVRLADMRARAWLCAEELLGFRIHGGSMTNYIKLTDNPAVVETMIRILERRRYSGGPERARRVLLSRYLRARAMVALRRDDRALARESAKRSFGLDPLSPRAASALAGVSLAPGLVRRWLPALPQARTGPALQDQNSGTAGPVT